MLTMFKKNSIRDLYFVNGMNISEISRLTGHDRGTVRGVVNKSDWSEPQSEPKESKSKLDPYKEIIDGWLENDKRSKSKQRHTSRRVYDRLRMEPETKDTFNCSYELVNTYVQKRKKEIFGSVSDGYIPLEHNPGEAQCDFGSADYYENGTLVKGHHLNLSFPHSNQGYAQLFPGENLECLLEGLENIFFHIGGVPHEIWFDNAISMVTTILTAGRRGLTEKFIRFKEHYGFTARFCNPHSGHEKGSVECKVGYIRRNLLVPVPRFKSLGEHNIHLLEQCGSDGAREHYRKEVRISDLFEKDKEALLPLPRNRFDTARHEVLRVDKYGLVSLDEGRHEYSTSPKFAGGTARLRITSTEVLALDEKGCVIAQHKRMYGDAKSRSMFWVPYLELLARRPRAVKYCGVRSILPEEIRDCLDRSAPSETSAIIRMIAELTEKTGFESAVETVAQAAGNNVSDPDSLKALHRKLHMDIPELPPLQDASVPRLDPLMPDLSRYNIGPGMGVR